MTLTPKSSPVAPYVMVFLNDKLQRYVIYVDETSGCVKRHKLDACGRMYLDNVTRQIAVETLYGKAEIVLKPNAPEDIKQYYEQMRAEEVF